MINDKLGKVISISSVKGGVGKTCMTISLAGIYYTMKKKVLIIDGDFNSGGISSWLGNSRKKDIYELIEAIKDNTFTNIEEYVASYNKGIDILMCPKDPKNRVKINYKYISKILNIVKKNYDVILIDTNHIINDVNLMILDNSYTSLFIITNDLLCLKNMKNMINIFKDNSKTNYIVCLNKSLDKGKGYFSLYDIRKTIKTNIDYTIKDTFNIKNIDKYILDKEILTLNKKILRVHSKDIEHIQKIALELISEKYQNKETTK